MVGGIAAWLGFTLPSAIAMVLFALVARNADLSSAGWVDGLKIAAVAIVAQAVYLMARALTPDWPRRLVAALAAVVALAWTTPFAQVAIIAAGALIGRLLLAPPVASPTGPEPSPVSRRVGMVCLTAFVALLVGLPLLAAVGGQSVALFEAFYRSGALVFGGGHVVLPLLHATVVDPGWVSNDQFLAGYGAAQAVPGPLFTFSAYLGAAVRPVPERLAGATIALIAIFLPSFLLDLRRPAVLGSLARLDRRPAGPDRHQRGSRRHPCWRRSTPRSGRARSWARSMSVSRPSRWRCC